MGADQPFDLSMSDGIKIHVHRWMPEANPACVLLVSHGMGEHGGRYARFAEKMNEAGIAVYAPDQRGHGRTAGSRGRLGHIADHDGWERLVTDLDELSAAIRGFHPDKPLFLLGHSMGSLLARRYIQRYNSPLNGVILIATGGDPGLAGRLGLWIARSQIRLRGLRKPSPLLKRLLFGGFNRRFRPRRTGFEWLNRDEREVDRYLQDPWVAASYSAAFFRDLIGGTLALHHPRNWMATPRDLPMLFLSGERDPLGKFGKDTIRVCDRYKTMGCRDVTIKLYPDARHELLHERNREEVFADIAEWIRNRTH